MPFRYGKTSSERGEILRSGERGGRGIALASLGRREDHRPLPPRFGIDES